MGHQPVLSLWLEVNHVDWIVARAVDCSELCQINRALSLQSHFFGFNANVETLRGRNVETLGTTWGSTIRVPDTISNHLEMELHLRLAWHSPN